MGGVISYATRLKATLAGVDVATLAELGPVAERTAAEMASGVAERCNADWGVMRRRGRWAGISGRPSVGEVFVAVSHPAGDLLRVKELSLDGERAAIRQQAAVACAALLAEALGLNRAPLSLTSTTRRRPEREQLSWCQ